LDKKIFVCTFTLQMGQIKDQKLLQKIALVFKELRETKGVTQEDVYNDTNIHIGRVETANANLSVSTLSALCKYFKLSLSEFFKKVEST
jgi:transcriptional regulator with XRE-family HTH domain